MPTPLEPRTRLERFANALNGGEMPDFPEATLSRLERIMKAAGESYSELLETKLDTTFIHNDSPTAADPGQVGQFWYNSVTGELYILTEAVETNTVMLMADADATTPANAVYRWELISGGGGGQGIFVGFVTNGGAFPTTRLDGTALEEEDYVRPASTATFPFTIGAVTFTNGRDKAIYSASIAGNWILDPGLLQSTAETPVKLPADESLSGTASIQSIVNKENKVAINSSVKTGTFEKTADGKVHLNLKDRLDNDIVESNIEKVVFTEDTQTITNKTIDADNNTITNLEGDNLKTQAADKKGQTWVVQDDGTWALGKAGNAVDDVTVEINADEKLQVKDGGLTKVKTSAEFWTDNEMTGTTKAENIVVSGDATVDTLTVNTNSSVPDPTSDDNIANKKYVDGKTQIVDNLTSTDTDKSLSANQGKVLNENKVDKVVTEDSGAISTIDNSKGQHGAVMQSNFDDTIVSFNTADENGENGILAQIYAKTKSTNNGVRLNVKKTGMYYSKGTSATTNADEELATLGSITHYTKVSSLSSVTGNTKTMYYLDRDDYYHGKTYSAGLYVWSAANDFTMVADVTKDISIKEGDGIAVDSTTNTISVNFGGNYRITDGTQIIYHSAFTKYSNDFFEIAGAGTDILEIDKLYHCKGNALTVSIDATNTCQRIDTKIDGNEAICNAIFLDNVYGIDCYIVEVKDGALAGKVGLLLEHNDMPMTPSLDDYCELFAATLDIKKIRNEVIDIDNDTIYINRDGQLAASVTTPTSLEIDEKTIVKNAEDKIETTVGGYDYVTEPNIYTEEETYYSRESLCVYIIPNDKPDIDENTTLYYEIKDSTSGTVLTSGHTNGATLTDSTVQFKADYFPQLDYKKNSRRLEFSCTAIPSSMDIKLTLSTEEWGDKVSYIKEKYIPETIMKTNTEGFKSWLGTESEYAAIAVKDPKTLYYADTSIYLNGNKLNEGSSSAEIASTEDTYNYLIDNIVHLDVTVTYGTAVYDEYIKKDVYNTIRVDMTPGYVLPLQKDVKIKNANIIDYDRENGIIAIGDITGDVTVEFACIMKPYSIDATITNGSNTGDPEIVPGTNATVVITPDDGFILPFDDTGIVIENADFVSYDNITGELVLNHPIGTVKVECTLEALPFDGLCLQALEDNSTFKITKGGGATMETVDLQYSTDGTTWIGFGVESQITMFNRGRRYYIRNNTTNFSTSASNYLSFELTGSVDASGKISSLRNFDENLVAYCYYGMFRCENYSTALKNAKGLIFPTATTVPNSTYAFMFRRNTGLLTAPDLTHITSLGAYAMSSMFNNCQKLSVAENYPAGTAIITLPAGTSTDSVNNMFFGTAGSFQDTPTAGNTYYYY